MDDDPFFTLDLLNIDENSLDVLELFTKSGFRKPAAVEAARRSKDRRMLRRVLKAEFDPLSPNAIKYILNTIFPSETDESRRSELTQLVQQEWRTFIKSRSRSIAPIPNHASASTTENTYIKLPTLDGSVEIPIYASWEGQDFTTKLSLWGKISNGGNIVLWDGEWMTPSQAGKRSRFTVDPNATGHVNGMTYWHLRDPEDGKLRPINDFHYDKEVLINAISAIHSLALRASV